MKKSFKLFLILFKKSQTIIGNNKRLYFPIISLLLFLNCAELIINSLGLSRHDNSRIWLNLVTGLLNFVLIAQIVLWQKRAAKSDDKLIYVLPTYLLYNLYYSLAFILGFFLLIFSGFYALIYFFMAPFIAVLDDTSTGNYFNRSRILVKKDFWLVAIISILILLLEVFSYFTDSAGGYAPILSSIDAYLSVVLTITSVEIYYYLMEKN